jgi:hypothetical protein
MVDSSEDALFREIEEDLQRDRMARLWRRYGSWIIALAVAIVIAVAAREGWRWSERRQAEAASARYLAALDLAAGDPLRAQEALRVLADDGHEGYALLARLREGSAYMQQGNLQAAAAVYGEIEDAAPRPAFRDLAVILGGYASLGGTPNPEYISEWRGKLTPLAAAGSPWRFSARELLAILELQSGNRGKAKELFMQIDADPEAPADMRSRAEMIVAQLGEG